jgi:hypothetical protein
MLSKSVSHFQKLLPYFIIFGPKTKEDMADNVLLRFSVSEYFKLIQVLTDETMVNITKYKTSLWLFMIWYNKLE